MQINKCNSSTMLTIWKRYAFPNTAEYVKRYQKNSYKLGNIKQFQTKLFLFPNYKLLIIINNLNKIKKPHSHLDHNSSNRIFFTTTNVFRRQYISLQIKTIMFFLYIYQFRHPLYSTSFSQLLYLIASIFK